MFNSRVIINNRCVIFKNYDSVNNTRTLKLKHSKETQPSFILIIIWFTLQYNTDETSS